MPVVLILLALIGAYFIWRASKPSSVSGSGPQSRIMHRGQCKWLPTGNDTVSLAEYYCKTCKVTAYAQGGTPPKECKKNLRGSL
ncbi:hypothetical protein SAMN04488515_1144 [Cognatiyoonia koreensis]|uniref:Uncharacterized protein n=1 Tax=Cognatiyoonia koreensis TaxID=364200 RepID=A0A1I0PBT8_9RHOB|nr:hypothetical protein SAMN04488515_1144 [Cognatiyoonia koreensis]